MEVLKHGKLKIKKICPTCECEFLYDKKKDVKFHGSPSLGYLPSGKERELSKNIYWYVICPECNNSVILDINE